ncbi:prephenate dehydratase [Sutcliffiella rhizosphaerae]|uniref:Prephenate dehydratase n=1 Tax=Sutcliffiella rhizosphaerae TaxID=2880967 RepID=A0ABN8A397_9BACI|nr:prephenate dehydratase [Sutcliffiella rhizosphaerae]CAG9619484.1 Bifunctional chorismate mutase/prephenate dehydratase [Sutcliffiella rhizosphaerae]
MKPSQIGFLGPKATFTDLAVTKFFPDSEKKAFATIPECMDAVLNGSVEAAVVPLENAIEGSVNVTLDYLIHDCPLPIVGELTIPIRQHLLVHTDHLKNGGELEVIYSHSHAIAQCHKYLHTHYPEAVYEPTSSTAAAAKLISDHRLSKKAACIANSLAAKEYKLAVLQEDIHDYDNNHTKFIVLHRDQNKMIQSEVYESSGEKTTLMVTLPTDHSGALHQVLSVFAWRKLNLSKIESRPMKTGLGNYFFIIDVNEEMNHPLIPPAIEELESLGSSVKILGKYHSYSIK